MLLESLTPRVERRGVVAHFHKNRANSGKDKRGEVLNIEEHQDGRK